MDYLEELVDEYRSPTIRGKKIPFTDILACPEDEVKINYSHVNRIIDAIREFSALVRQIWNNEDDKREASEKYEEYKQQKQMLIDFINTNINPNINTLYCLLKRLEKKENSDIKSNLFYILFSIKNEAAFRLLKESVYPVEMLRANPNGDVELYGMKFTKTCNI